MWRSIERSYRRWVGQQDFDLLRASATPASWVTFTLLLAAVLGALSLTSLRGVVGLELAPVALAFVPAIVVGTAGSAVFARRLVPEKLLPAFMAVSNGLLVFGVSSASVFSSDTIGRNLFATLLLLVCGVQGQTQRGSIREPFPAVATALGMAAAVALRPTLDVLAVFGAVGPFGVYLSLQLGAWAIGASRAQTERLRYRDALQAQVVLERTQELAEFRDVVVGLLGRKHDLNNDLQVLLANVDVLLVELEARGNSAADLEARKLVLEIDAGLRRLHAAIGDPKGTPPSTAGPPRDRTPIEPVASAILRTVQSRHPEVRLDLDLERDLVVLLDGGAASLHRILQNLVLNACEGNGKEAAAHVVLHAARKGDRVELAVLDDGPGFVDSMLTAPPSLFGTTKETGSGIGLFTVERMVRSNGGTFTRENRETRGAAVRVSFPAPPPDAPS